MVKAVTEFQDSYSLKKENGSSFKTTYDHLKNVTLYVSGVSIGLSEESFTNLFEDDSLRF